MARKSDRPLEKVTIRLFAGDFERLERLYPSSGGNRPIRELVHRHLQAQEEKFAERTEGVGVDLPKPEVGQDLT